LTLTQQQIDLFSAETQMSQERVKDANWEFTKEVAKQVSSIAHPDPNLTEVATKFLVILDQKDLSWEVFVGLVGNFSPLKALMNNFSSECLSEETLQSLMPLWKNQLTLNNKLKHNYFGMSVILRWICTNVELKLKKETLKSQQRKIPELQKKVKEYLNKISEENSRIVQIQAQLTEKRNDLEQCRNDDSVDRFRNTNHTNNANYNSNSTGINGQATHLHHLNQISPNENGYANGNGNGPQRLSLNPKNLDNITSSQNNQNNQINQNNQNNPHSEHFHGSNIHNGNSNGGRSNSNQIDNDQIEQHFENLKLNLLEKTRQTSIVKDMKDLKEVDMTPNSSQINEQSNRTDQSNKSNISGKSLDIKSQDSRLKDESQSKSSKGRHHQDLLNFYSTELRQLSEKQKNLELQFNTLSNNTLGKSSKVVSNSIEKDINIGNDFMVQDNSDNEQIDIKIENSDNPVCCRGNMFCFGLNGF